MNEPAYEYRVVTVYTDGIEFATVAFRSREYAESIWSAANRRDYIARCWIERRPLGDWTVCSSETGTEFMALRPASRANEETT